MNARFLKVLMLCVLLVGTSACTVISVVDTAASAAVGATKLVVKGTVAAVDAVIPDGDDEEDD